MTNDAQATGHPTGAVPGMPPLAGRATFQAELDTLRAREN